MWLVVMDYKCMGLYKHTNLLRLSCVGLSLMSYSPQTFRLSTIVCALAGYVRSKVVVFLVGFSKEQVGQGRPHRRRSSMILRLPAMVLVVASSSSRSVL